jgi:pimeloyl-ACP methyl ester carboxylesterase
MQVLDDGSFLRYLDLEGPPPVTVWLHGFPLASTAYLATFAASQILPTRRHLLPDFLGFGYSSRPQDFGYTMQEHANTVAHLMDKTQLSGCDVIGQSWGGSIAVLLADARPDLVNRLVLVDAYLDAGGGGPLARSIASQPEADYIATGHAELVRDTQKAALESGSEIAAAFLATLEVAAPHAVYRSAQSLIEGVVPSMRERLARLQNPRCYIVGANEDRGDLDSLANAGVSILQVEGAGRFMFAEQPGRFIAALASGLIG